MSTIPATITVYHKAWTETGATDAHGNPVTGYGTAIPRQVQAISLAESREIISPDAAYLNRTETLLEMAVPDGSVYAQKDQIILGATGIANGDPVGGVEYHVEAVPSDNKLGFLPLLNRMLGAVVQIRRVT